MPHYVCKRCGYDTDHLTNLKTHLRKNKVCVPLYTDVDRASLLAELTTKLGKTGSTLSVSDEVVSYEDIKDPQMFVATLQAELNKLKRENLALKKVHYNDDDEGPMGHADAPPPISVCTTNLDSFKKEVGCPKCDATLEDECALEVHMRVECEKALFFDNVYEYNEATFGRSLYADKKGAGEIYIVQTDFVESGETYTSYKIGKTTNLEMRMMRYRTPAAREPRLHRYYPFKNVVRAESALMGLLEEYHVKREIYHGELESICAIVRGYQRMTDGCVAEFTPTLLMSK